MKSILYKYRLFIGIFYIFNHYFVAFLCGLKPSKSLPIFNPLMWIQS
jgi:protein SCO1/2